MDVDVLAARRIHVDLWVRLQLDAGEHLLDVQDLAGHRDPRTTQHCDRRRHTLDRSATYALSAYIG